VNSGFPFTRMADFSESAVVLPDRPSSSELTAYLNVMGRLASLSGYPPVRMMVVRAGGLPKVQDRDLLVIGTTGHLQGVSELLASGPLSIAGDRISMQIPREMDSIRRLFADTNTGERQRAGSSMQAASSGTMAALLGFESPYHAHRSVVAIIGGSPESLEGAVASLADSDQAALIQGDLSILTTGKVTSYRVAEPYTVGTLPFWLYPSYILRDQPYAIVLLMLVASLMCGSALYLMMRRRTSVRLTPTRPPAPNVR
jgi:cellulose synthase (UDP-forming)